MARKTKSDLEHEKKMLAYELMNERNKNALHEHKERERKKALFQGIYLAIVIGLFAFVDEGYGLWVIFGAIPLGIVLQEMLFKDK